MGLKICISNQLQNVEDEADAAVPFSSSGL